MESNTGRRPSVPGGVPVIPRPDVPEKRQLLSRELSAFLVQLSSALHKNAAYPEGHPLLLSAVDAVALRLTSLLKDRTVLSLGVTKNQLIIEGGATEQSNAVLRDLAERLYRHQLGAIRFVRGVSPDEVADFLKTIGSDRGRDAQPLGLRPPPELERWPHVRVVPLAFDQLELAGAQPVIPELLADTRATVLWRSLAAAALGSEDAASDQVPPEPAEVANAINSKIRGAAYDRVIVNHLLQLSQELRLSQGGDASILQERLIGLVAGLKPEVLSQLLELGGAMTERKQLVEHASYTMPVAAVLALTRAASVASQQTSSHSLLRLLSKFANYAEAGAPTIRADADAALRETVREMVSDWNIDDPNPESYTHLLERLARGTNTPSTPEGAGESEADRIVKISLEIGASGELVWRAFNEMITDGKVSVILDLLDRVANQEGIVEEFWRHLVDPDCIRQLLIITDGKNFDAVERILSRMGISAAEPMFEALEATQNRTVRRRLLTHLSQLGVEIGPKIVARLPISPWFVQRNLLSLLSAMPTWPADFSPLVYAESEDPRVRREALKLMLRLPAFKETAINAGLVDSDPQNVRLTLSAALEECPASAEPLLMLLLANKDTSSEDRLLAIRTLATIHSGAAREWLTARVLTKKGWFRGPRLQAKSPEMLAALVGLSSFWRDEPSTSKAVRLAAASKDSEIRAAVSRPP